VLLIGLDTVVVAPPKCGLAVMGVLSASNFSPAMNNAGQVAALAASASNNFLVETDTYHAAGIEPRAAISTSLTRLTISGHPQALPDCWTKMLTKTVAIVTLSKWLDVP
jgi:hypothetical protein